MTTPQESALAKVIAPHVGFKGDWPDDGFEVYAIATEGSPAGRVKAATAAVIAYLTSEEAVGRVVAALADSGLDWDDARPAIIDPEFDGAACAAIRAALGGSDE